MTILADARSARVRNPGEATSSATDGGVGSDERRIEILVVDDEPSVRGFIARVLTRNGFACRTAADANEALIAASEGAPALTVCDLRMPGKDGNWLLRELKRRWPGSAVIMLSAIGDARTAVECLKSGAEDYLVKPIDLDELLIAVRRTTEGIRIRREAKESRERLAEARDRTVRLQEAFKVIEETYRDALGGLLRTSETPSGNAGGSNEGPDEPVSRPVATITPDIFAKVELAALRIGGRLIGERATSVQVASAIGQELVDKGPLLYARLWTWRTRGGGLEAVVDIGGSALPGLELARRAMSTAETQCEESAGRTTVTCPIRVGGATEGVLQLAWQSSRSANMVSITERLALVMAASVARELESKDRERTAEELELFDKLAGATRHSLDLEHVAEFLFASLHRIVDYDVAGLLLLEDEPCLSVRTRFVSDGAFAEGVRDRVLNTLKITCGVELSEALKVQVEELDRGSGPLPQKQQRSFVNVPFSVGGRVVGLIHVSSGRDRAFTQGEVQFLNRAANFLARSVQGVRDLLRAVKGRVEQMVDHMSDGVLMLDRRGKVVAMNRASRGMLVASEGATSWDESSLVEILDFEPLALLEEQPEGVKKVVGVRGVAYQAQVSAVTDDAGELTGAVVAFRNFDEEKQADEMKSELVNTVSHELRTPLTAIRNALFLLKRPKVGALSDQQDRFVGLAQRNVEQLIETVNDLLDLSKIEAGKMHIQLGLLSVAEPLSTAVASLTPHAESNGVSLETRCAPNLPEIFGNTAALQRVLMNLIGNAIKYTERGGQVSVDASLTVDEGEKSSHPAVKISVTDSGVGIPRDQLETIFDKFQQANRTDGLQAVGTGLGLSICRELVKAHHGRIWAESEEGCGSRFSLVVPLLTESELFFRTLATELERAHEQRAPLALVVGRVLNAEVLEDELGGDQLSELLDELLGSAQSILRRSGDQILLRHDARQIVALLPRTAADGGHAFETRLQAAISESRFSQKGIEIGLGCAIHPQDGASPEELYRVAETRVNEGVPA